MTISGSLLTDFLIPGLPIRDSTPPATFSVPNPPISCCLSTAVRTLVPRQSTRRLSAAAGLATASLLPRAAAIRDSTPPAHFSVPGLPFSLCLSAAEKATTISDSLSHCPRCDGAVLGQVTLNAMWASSATWIFLPAMPDIATDLGTTVCVRLSEFTCMPANHLPACYCVVCIAPSLVRYGHAIRPGWRP